MTLDLVRSWLDGHVPPGAMLACVVEERLGLFSNEVLRLRLEWAPPDASLPASLIVKRRIPGREAPASEAFENEARILREIAAPAPVHAPRVFAASEQILAMEDLESLEPFHFVAGATDAHAVTALEALARLHAHGVSNPPPRWLPSFADPSRVRALADRFDRVWHEHRVAVSSVVPAAFPGLADAWSGRVARIPESLADSTTILHGDAHGENLPLNGPSNEESGVAFLDWAAAHAGPPAFDVAVFLGMSLPPERRRAHEREWVAGHAEVWASAGAPPFPDPWRSYARGLLLRAFHLVSQVRDPELLRNSGFAFVVGRCAQAALDHAGAAELD